MKYFFALVPGRRLEMDASYMARHRTALLVRNTLMVVLYGLVVTRIQQDYQFLSVVLTVLAGVHALMVGIVLGRRAGE
jgi:hypothetical protein